MDFKERVKDSFVNIRQDFEKINNDYSLINDRLSLVENSESAIAKSVEQIMNRMDEFTAMLKGISSRLNNVEKQGCHIESVLSGISPNDKMNNGKSSIGSRGNITTVSSANVLKCNPVVSSGTSSKRNHARNIASKTILKSGRSVSRRSRKIKEKILSYDVDNMNIKQIYELVVVKDYLCSKTSFYRFIKELESEGVIEVFLDSGKRKIRVLKFLKEKIS